MAAKPSRRYLPRVHWNLPDASRRLVESLAPILQITFAATGAYLFAFYVLNHHLPMLAVTVTITSLGFTRDARPRRIIETATGMVTGIALSEVLLNTIGQGVWQLGLVLLICLSVARFLSGSAAFALAAGIQSMLVIIVPEPAGGVFTRSIDGLVGGLTAILVTALIPRDPRGLAKFDANKLFGVFLGSLDDLALALKNADVKAADATLGQVRKTQPLVDNWRLSLDSAIAISKISPFLRKYRDELAGQLRLLRGMDLATRNLRVLVRRVYFLMRDGQRRPHLEDLIQQISQATRVLSEGLENSDRLLEAEELFVGIIHQLDPKLFAIADQISEASVILLMRPLLVDLLCASGLSVEDARAELPKV